MQILCREQRDDEVEQEVTQRDQFNTDEVKLVSTLIREPHQNSLDAPDGSGNSIRTRLRIVEPTVENQEYFTHLFSGLVPHLEASGIDLSNIDLGMPRILVIEDFNTTGLTGNFSDKKEKCPFNNFWRRIGRSNKGGAAGGRWGLGKLVFSSASEIQAFFGLTIRHDDKEKRPYLMGQAVLANREVAGKVYAPHVFFAEQGETNLQLPTSDEETIQKFRKAFGITRTNEAGLSIAIPFVLPQIDEKSLIPEVLQNYFFPILTGKLVVEVGSQIISEETFDIVSEKYGMGGSEANAPLVSFVRELHLAKEPDVVMQPCWTDSIEEAIEDSTLDKLRIKLGNEGGLIQVRAPLLLKKKDGEQCTTYFDLFLKKAPDGTRGRALYVRGSITVPDEARYFVPHQTFGALIASDMYITSFLGDAENPAHTKWNGQADKLKNWKNASVKLREIRNSLTRLQNALMRAVETVEPDALKDLFNIRNKSIPEQLEKRNFSGKTKPKIVIPAGPKPWYRIERAANGFTVSKGDGLIKENLPFELKIKVAYDVAYGNPFTKFKPYDFDFNKKKNTIKANGANLEILAANELNIFIESQDFNVEILGFDEKRDLIIKATR